MLETTAVMSQSPSLALLPDELIVEIFVKLPVKSLLQIRCVCKLWKTLISHPQFAQNHLHNSISNTCMTHHRLALVYDDYPNKAVTYSMHSLLENPPTPTDKLTLNMEGEHNKFIGSLNGLLCLCDDNDCFRLWNPSTRLDSKRSPPALFHKKMTSMHNDDAFFGYDKVNDKYKVLAFGDVDLKIVAKLYTFGESYWTTIKDLPCPIERTCRTFVSVNGNLHWLNGLTVKGASGILWLNGKPVIISFDVEKETHGEMLFPPQFTQLDSYYNYWFELFVSTNYLYVCQIVGEPGLVLWEMKEYGVQESWTKLMIIPYKISSICGCYIFGCPFHLYRPLYILENGVVLLITSCCRGHLVMYDSNNGTFGHCEIPQRSHVWRLGIYHESLVSPP